MTFLTFNKFVNEELEKFYEDSKKEGNLKAPIDFDTMKYDYQESKSFVVEPKIKKTQIKTKKIWKGTNKNKGLF